MGAYATLMNFRSTTFRLQEFFSAAQSAGEESFGALDSKGGPSFACSLTQAPSSGLTFVGTVSLPLGRVLHRDVSLKVPPGTWAMLRGPSGCGKTTLLRALVGLWPFGSGSVQRPEDASMVPAESTARLLRGASLREVLCYPRPNGQFPDGEMEAALRAVELGCLLEAVTLSAKGSEAVDLLLTTGRDEVASFLPEKPKAATSPLDRREDWSLALSSGQRQRLEFAFLLCARPELVILDEPTAHLPTEAALRLLATMKRLLPASTTFLTVSHDPELAKCHELQLKVSADGIIATASAVAQ